MTRSDQRESDWITRLRANDTDGAWDLFIERHRRFIFAAIRHYTTEHDEVMDVFAQVCESLRADGLRRLRRYVAEGPHSARFSTWLVAVVRNLTVDWFRHRDGRKRLSEIAAQLPPLQRQIFECVFADGRSHLETYELLSTRGAAGLSFGTFLRELRTTYLAIAARRKGALMPELWGPLPPQDIELAPPDELGQAERAARITEALDSLSADDRLVVQLFVMDDLPAADVARIIGLPNAKAVYNRAYRILADLREHFERIGMSKVDL